MFEDVDEGHLDGEEPVVFRYNREERIKKAPKIVQEYYAGGLRPVRGFKALVANKSNRFVLLALVFFVAATWLYTGLNNTRSYGKINDISLELQGFSYEDSVFSSLKIFNKNASEKSNPVKVDAEFFLINNDHQIVEKESLSLVYRDGDQYLRTKHTDYDIIRVDVIVTIDGKEKELFANIKK